MTTYYVDPNASGSDNGDPDNASGDYSNAWTTLQRAIDGTNGTQPGAGDTVHLKSAGSGDDETLAATIDVDGTSGSLASGRAKFIGVNSSWVNDGTRYVINANSKTNGLLCAGSYKHVENIEIYGASGDGVDWTNVYWYGWLLKNVVSRDNTGSGFDLYYSEDDDINGFIECQAYDNGGGGFIAPYKSVFMLHCVAHSNTGNGFEGCEGNGSIILKGCLSYKNTLANFNKKTKSGYIFDSVLDDSVDGIQTSGDSLFVSGCRITNGSAYGVDATASSIVDLYNCYLGGNTTDDINSGNVTKLLHKGVATVTEDGSDTLQGYTSVTDSAENYNLSSSATQRRIAIDLEQ